MIRTYSELITIPTFIERFRYLVLDGKVGESTFGFDRYLNQAFYRSPEWRKLRNDIFVRDLGCDLAVEGMDIFDTYHVHHMNPLSPHDLVDATEYLTNPEFLITVSPKTHTAITYASEDLLPKDPVIRRPYDTCPWRTT